MGSLAELEDSLYKRNQELEAKASSTLANIRATISNLEQGVNTPILVVEDEPTEAVSCDEVKPVTSKMRRSGSMKSESRISTSGTAASAGGAVKSRQSSLSCKDSNTANHTALLDVDTHPEASMRLHKARIRTLEEELLSSQQTIKDQQQDLEEARKELKALRAEKAAWNKSEKNMLSQLEKLKRQTAGAEAAAHAKEQFAKEVTQDNARADEERRQAQADARSKSAQLNHALEEVRRYKQLLQDFQAQEREGKDVARADYNKLLADRKRLERQRNELLVAFRKQLKLIDVLKRQKIHMEAARALAFTEEEFMKTLDMGSV